MNGSALGFVVVLGAIAVMVIAVVLYILPALAPLLQFRGILP